jgi:uncharacterized protein YcaQ
MNSLSLAQAKKLALLSQGLATKAPKNRSASETLAVFERLGYVQIDTISVVQRAHHHTLWARNPHYQLAHLDGLVADKKVFEYWSHAAAYLPMSDYRFSLPRKAAIKSGQQRHWHDKDHRVMASILKRIEVEGPLMAKDFVSKSPKKGGWGSAPTKQALETLFMQGDLMIPERRNFHKVYDLTERVIPSALDTTMPTAQEHAQFLVHRYLKSHGFGDLAEITYLLKGVKASVKQALDELAERGEIEIISIGQGRYYTASDSLARLSKRLHRKQVQILSPFDNLLIQRKRARSIFNFDYLLECYVPAAKRQFGYFSLPILWDGTLVARADCKANKKTATLHVIHLAIESSLRDKNAFLAAFEQALDSFARFNQCDSYQIEKLSTP